MRFPFHLVLTSAVDAPYPFWDIISRNPVSVSCVNILVRNFALAEEEYSNTESGNQLFQ